MLEEYWDAMEAPKKKYFEGTFLFVSLSVSAYTFLSTESCL